MYKFMGKINGAYLRRLRKDRGYKGVELADLMGIAESTYYKWEAGRQIPSIAKIQMLQYIYGECFDYNQLLSIKFKKCYNSEIGRKGGNGEVR